jgi:hypothetical protein
VCSDEYFRRHVSIGTHPPRHRPLLSVILVGVADNTREIKVAYFSHASGVDEHILGFDCRVKDIIRVSIRKTAFEREEYCRGG